MRVTTLFLLVSSSVGSSFTAHDFELLLEGVAYGALETVVDVSESCVTDGVMMMEELEEAIEDILEDTNESVKEGITMIGEIIQESSKELMTCESAKKDFEALVDMADAFAHPVGFFFHAGKEIVIHHTEITNEIEDATELWHVEDYYNAGYNIGKALSLIMYSFVVSD